MKNHSKLLVLLATLLALVLVASACGNDDDDTDSAATDKPTASAATETPAATEAPAATETPVATEAPTATEAPADAPVEATGEPIKVGNVSSLTGGALFPEASVAAKAVFDRVNAGGGINGRPIQLVVEDDAGTPEGAATAGRKLVEQDNVVAMVGSASTLECAVNSAFYAEKGVYSIQGTGVDPLCFLSSNISPVNTGPYAGITVSLFYASETLGLEDVCNVNLFVIPDLAPAFDAAVERWEALTGKTLTLRVGAATLEDDPTPLMLQARDAGCDAVVIDGVEPHALAVGRAIESQSLSDIIWIGLTSYYTDSIASQLGSAGNGLRANSEFEPYGSDSPVLDDWRSLMTDAGVPLTSFAQGGYIAATIFVEALRGINGEITRESVAEAMRTLEPYETPLLGTPYTFGPGETHAPNQASKFVELRDGEWVTVADDWVILPG
ncbi:MAG: ABC transporter substrate-binding protein [bacterium]|nr:ABC transporter substrate-binding protein [bacterium]MCY4133903.1 ABC transporter substrate-binding protein [bacterium]